MKPTLSALLFFVLLSAVYAQKNDKQQLPYQDSALSVELRVTDLLGRMTLDEKISQMNMLSLNNLNFDKSLFVVILTVFASYLLVKYIADPIEKIRHKRVISRRPSVQN